MRYTEVISVVTQKWARPCESAAWLTAAGRCSQGLLILSRPTVRGWGRQKGLNVTITINVSGKFSVCSELTIFMEMTMQDFTKEFLAVALPFITSTVVSLMMIITVGKVWWSTSPILALFFCLIATAGTVTSMVVTFMVIKENLENG